MRRIRVEKRVSPSWSLPGAITFPASQSSSITRSKFIWSMTDGVLGDKSDVQ
jgi:hypothetical protein